MNKDRVEGFMFGVSIGFLVAHLLKPLLYLNNTRLRTGTATPKESATAMPAAADKARAAEA